jgi:hypothetical protein
MNKEQPRVTKALFGEQESNEMTAKDARFLMQLQEIYSKEDIEMKTDLNQAQINALAKGQLYASIYNVPIVKELCNRVMLLLVSKGRNGRKEFVDMAKSMNSEEDAKPTLPDRLMGNY